MKTIILLFLIFGTMEAMALTTIGNQNRTDGYSFSSSGANYTVPLADDANLIVLYAYSGSTTTQGGGFRYASETAQYQVPTGQTFYAKMLDCTSLDAASTNDGVGLAWNITTFTDPGVFPTGWHRIGRDAGGNNQIVYNVYRTGREAAEGNQYLARVINVLFPSNTYPALELISGSQVHCQLWGVVK